MKLHIFTVEPRSPFGTPLKADTLFGHFCWQARHRPDLLDVDLDILMREYDHAPFVIFSSAFPRLASEQTPFAVPRPLLPPRRFFSAEGSRIMNIMGAKEQKKLKWLLLDQDLRLSLDKARMISDEQLARLALPQKTEMTSSFSFTQDCLLNHNSINRLTGTTGSAAFAPYQSNCTVYAPNARLAIMVAIHEKATSAEKVEMALERIGASGFGRDASTGWGRFQVVESRPVDWPIWPSTGAALYTTGPTVLKKAIFDKIYHKPFVRFGRHGDYLASGPHPFKNPVIMADEGTVCLLPSPVSDFPKYIGSAVRGVSKAMPQTVVQGYAICLPLHLPVGAKSQEG